jgi:CubicO group peptidase (beta-lactamase class C family)
MSHQPIFLCRQRMFCMLFLLFFQVANAQKDFSKVDDWLNNHKKDLGGRAVLMVFANNQIVYEQTLNDMSRKQKLVAKIVARKTGQSKADMTKDFDADSRQRIASCSKWLTAALCMSFVDEGKLKTTDSIGQYLPVMTAHGKGKILVSDCLAHLTGIEQAKGKESFEIFQQVNNMDEAMLALAKQPMEGEPGKTFHYGNAGLQIIGAICEKIGGDNFENLFAKRIAQPLQMTNTDFGKKAVPLAAGGAFSTPKDYMNFLIMILNRGLFNGKRILSEKSIADMQQNRTANTTIVYTPAQAVDFSYGFGEWIQETDKGMATVVSSPGLFGSLPVVDYKNGYAFFLFVFNLKAKERKEDYSELKKLLDEALHSGK